MTDRETRLRERIDDLLDEREKLRKQLVAARKLKKRWHHSAWQRALQRDVWIRRHDDERARRIQLERRLTAVERAA